MCITDQPFPAFIQFNPMVALASAVGGCNQCCCCDYWHVLQSQTTPKIFVSTIFATSTVIKRVVQDFNSKHGFVSALLFGLQFISSTSNTWTCACHDTGVPTQANRRFGLLQPIDYSNPVNYHCQTIKRRLVKTFEPEIMWVRRIWYKQEEQHSVRTMLKVSISSAGVPSSGDTLLFT